MFLELLWWLPWSAGFKNEEVEILTNWICDVVLDLGNADKINSTKDQVVEMCKRFPVYK